MALILILVFDDEHPGVLEIKAVDLQDNTPGQLIPHDLLAEEANNLTVSILKELNWKVYLCADDTNVVVSSQIIGFVY